MSKKKRKESRKGQSYKKWLNASTVKKQKEFYQMIDGNFTYYPYAYCSHYEGYLTINMANCHRCEARHCRRFEKLEGVRK